MADFKQGTDAEVKSGAAQYKAGAIFSDQAATPVGGTTRTVDRVIPGTQGSTKRVTETTGGEPIFHRIVIYPTQDDQGKVNGADRVVYIIKNGTYQPAAISKDGGKKYLFSDPNYPTMAGVAGADLQKDLNSNESPIRKNLDANTSQALTKAGVPKDQAKTIVASTQNDATTSGGQGDGTNPTGLQVLKPGQVKGTGRNKFPQELRYPLGLGKGTTQDVVQFTMLEYRPQEFDATQAGFTARKRDVSGKGIGTVYLPVPAGIRDSNGANWTSADMNAFQAAIVDLSKESIEKGAEGFKNVAENIAGKIDRASPELKQAVIQTFTAKATGVQGILARTQGAVINPNMELLFSGPTLRSFAFTYKLSARSKDEAKQIIQIIRFFKQGMSPQKSESNIFLKAPHTFQVRYLLRGQGEHPYIGKMKECALQNFSVNYTPEGNYATYEDGFMVSYEISMQLQELEPVFNNDYTELDNDADSQIGF